MKNPPITPKRRATHVRELRPVRPEAKRTDMPPEVAPRRVDPARPPSVDVLVSSTAPAVSRASRPPLALTGAGRREVLAVQDVVPIVRRKLPAPGSRISGVLIPVFACRSPTDAGIGDFGSVPAFLRWLAAAKQRMWMTLPLLPTGPNDPSPYGARSSVGFNRILIDLSQLPEFDEAGGEARLSARARKLLATARASKRIRYDCVFPAKAEALELAFARFQTAHLAGDGPRAREFRAYCKKEGDWVRDYALFEAVSEKYGQKPWWQWPKGVKERDPAALARVGKELESRVQFHAWTQWVAATQWQKVKGTAEELGILVCGDSPITVAHNSVDAWVNPRQVRRDKRLGVMPDPFSEVGQDWGTAYLDMAEMKKDGFAWLRRKTRKMAETCHVARVDHYVGLHRQYVRSRPQPANRFVPGVFMPGNTASPRMLKSQLALGRLLTEVMLSEGLDLIGEDLGVIPDAVRETLRDLGVPGYRVLRWERDVAKDGSITYRDPGKFDPVTITVTGTHDTDPSAKEYRALSAADRVARARAWPALGALGRKPPRAYTPKVHEAVLRTAARSASNLVNYPLEDVLGLDEPMNVPNTAKRNWEIGFDVPSAATAMRLARITVEGGRDNDELRSSRLPRRSSA